MTSRHRTTSSSRKDSYGQWRPSDSDSDRPRQTMATTQRHNVDQIVGAEAPRKHRSSRRAETVDPQEPSTSYSRHRHKSSSKDRSSSAQQASYYPVPPSPNPSQYQTPDGYYDLRAHLDLKRKTDKRSPRSREKALAGDEVKASRPGHRSSRQAHPTTAQYAQSITQAQPYPQAIVPPQPYTVPTQATRDPASSSRHHREREKDREKTTSRDPDRVKTRDPTETREEREKRKRREKDGEKERSSKDKERHREKDKHKDREARAAVETRPADASSVYHAYTQTAAIAQRSTDRIPAPYSDYTRPTQPATSAYPPSVAPVAMPWSGLTSAGRGAAAPAPEPTYPYTSDKEDPPLPIPPPERRRERTSSKPHRSHHHKVSSQQAGQDSGLSSSEQEQHSVLERPRTADRHHPTRDQASVLQRDQASVLQRGYSSGPSGSENEKVPTLQKERRKHRTHGESSRHKSKSASADVQPANGPTTSQEIASAWYSRLHSGTQTTPAVESSTQKVASVSAVPAQPSVHPSGKPASSVGLNASQRSAPRIVSIRAGQGPADPQTSSVLQKILSGTTPTRQPDPLPTHAHTAAYVDVHGYLHSSANTGALGPYEPSAQSYPKAVSSHSRPETSGGTPALSHGHQLAVPDVVVRPPSTAPAFTDPYAPRTTGGAPQPNPYSGQASGRPQVPDSRMRSTPAPQAQSTVYPQFGTQAGTVPDAHRSTTRVPANDLPSRFPVYEETAATRPSAAQSNASPKRGLTYPGASAPAPMSSVHANPSNYQGHAGYDPRSPKPPSVSTITPDTSRLQPYLAGSPAVVAHAVSAGSSGNTPRQSPSTRLHSHRNGSNDTITHGAPTKPSPTGSSQQQLPHRTSATTLQHHASSRHDITTSRQPNASSAYPDITRYRSPAPSGYPNANTSSAPIVAAPNHSQAYSTQTPFTSHDNQYGRNTNGPSQAVYAPQSSTAPGYGRYGQSVDHGRVQDPNAAIATSSAAPMSAQRIPPRSAPSPAPTLRPPRLTAVSSPSSRTPAPLHSAPPVPTRNQTYPTPVSTQAVATPFPAHSRTVSDPQYQGRVGAYASASLPTRGHVPPRAAPSPAPQMQNDILLTPSSLAPSMLPQVAPSVPLSRTTSKSTTKEKEKKKGFFGLSLFRSRSSPPKERAVDTPGPAATVREKRERNNSQPTQPQAYAQAPTTGHKIAPSQDAPRVAVAAAVSIPSQSQHVRGYSTNAVPIAAPTPVAAAGQRTTNGKMFTPFRLLSKRHRTVSTASVEAVDGTVINAMLTGGDSTRSSTAGRPSPPLRDPMTAAQEWRNKEENEQQGRGTLRRRRPGVTFDVGEEIPDDGRGPLQKSFRQNLQSLQASTSQAQAQVPMPTRQATA